jgi:hypothetical protein
MLGASTGTGQATLTLNYDDMVKSYISAMADGTTHANGRVTYVPLGSQELGALCRLYHVRLQTVSTASLFKSLNAVTVDECDPRAIPASDIHEFDKSQTRIVRLLNIKVTDGCLLACLPSQPTVCACFVCVVQSNHYNVALPIDPNTKEDDAATAKTRFSSFNYWSNDFGY